MCRWDIGNGAGRRFRDDQVIGTVIDDWRIAGYPASVSQGMSVMDESVIVGFPVPFKVCAWRLRRW
jgi:hypothetical protein